MWVREKIINIAEFLHPQHIDTANLSTLISGDFCMHRSPLFSAVLGNLSSKNFVVKNVFHSVCPAERETEWVVMWGQKSRKHSFVVMRNLLVV